MPHPRRNMLVTRRTRPLRRTPTVIDTAQASTAGVGAGTLLNVAGDLLVAWTGNSGSGTEITTGANPSLAVVLGQAESVASTIAAKSGYRISTGTNETINGWTGAGRIAAATIRDWAFEDNGLLLSGVFLNDGTLFTYDYPDLVFPDDDPRLCFIAHMANDVEIHGVPSGWSVLIDQGSPEMKVMVKDTLATSWETISVAQTSNDPGIMFSLAIRGALL